MGIDFFRNSFGWATNRKIIVLESDDWGSMRFPNRITLDKFLEKGYNVEKCWMSYNDSFETFEDLSHLIETLLDIKDKNGRSGCATLLFNPANPDYDKIQKSDFEEYYYKSFDEIVENRPNGIKLKSLYLDSIQKNILELGFHGREHLFVNRWLRDLQQEDPVAKLGFENKMWGFTKIYMPNIKHSYRSAFDLDFPSDLFSQKLILRDGIQLMEKMFNHKITYFLAPDGPYHLELNKVLIEKKLKYIGLAKIHINPLDKSFMNNKYQWLGKKLSSGLRVITRNVMFEPLSPRQTDWVNFSMNQIENAFKWRKPAVISSHRVNYVSGLNLNNQKIGLKELKKLLKAAKRKWPDIEFMTSSQLGKLISKNK